jgi:predicted N-formylglutamate amidohydrolase
LQASAKPGVQEAVQTVAVENATGTGAFVIVCDHASNRFPPEYGSLGLNPAEREAHIAWDPGALAISRHLSKLLDAPLVFSTVSRLVIDCNRDPAAPDSIVEKSVVSGIAIPGNRALQAEERRRRIAAVHAPYHAAIDELIDRRLAARVPTAVIAVHSFTPVLAGIERPWEASIIFDRHRALADTLIEGLSADGFNVGVNEPYSPADRVYYTLSRHAEARGLACAMIEIRNDLVRSEREEREWAEKIAACLAGTENAGLGNWRSSSTESGQNGATRLTEGSSL